MSAHNQKDRDGLELAEMLYTKAEDLSDAEEARCLHLIKNGANLEMREQESGGNTTPVILAAAYNRTKVLKALLDHGALVDAKTKSEEDEANENATALMIAANIGCKESVEILLAHGAYVDMCDANGTTALMVAAEGGHVSTLHALIKAGANTELTDNKGKNATDYTEDTDIKAAIDDAVQQRIVKNFQNAADAGTPKCRPIRRATRNTAPKPEPKP